MQSNKKFDYVCLLWHTSSKFLPKNGCVWAGKPTLPLRNASQQTKLPFVCFVHVVFLQSSKFQCNNALCFKKYRFFCVPSCSKCLLHFLSTVPTSGLGDLPTLISNGQLSAFCGPLKLCVARSVMGCSLDLYK